MNGEIEIHITLDPDPEGSPTVIVPSQPHLPESTSVKTAAHGPTSLLVDLPDSSPEEQGTRVDLGDDLIDHTAVVQHPGMLLAAEPDQSDVQDSFFSLAADLPGLSGSSEEAGEVEASQPIEFHAKLDDVPDSLESARILLSEGYLLDAKKLLQKLLIQDATNVRARGLLKEIQQTEIEALLADGGPKLPWETKKEIYSENLKSEAAIDLVISGLNQDLDLGLEQSVLTSRNRAFGSEVLGAVLDGFQDGAEIYRYFRGVEDSLVKSGATAQDYLDLGVGYLEMGRVTVASLLFGRTLKRLRCAEVPERALILSATCLLAEAKALCGDLSEAIGQLEALDRDPAFRDAEKLEVYYLLGKYYQSLEQGERAAKNFDQVLSLQPDFRDASVRRTEVERLL